MRDGESNLWLSFLPLKPSKGFIDVQGNAMWGELVMSRVPCRVFFGGLSDDVLIRTGTGMDLEGYMTKPVPDQSLLTTIKDKIKRG